MSTSVSQPPKTLRIANAVGYSVLIAVNVLSSYGVFGASNEVVSANYPTPITPAGWAFSIWALIFSTQGAAVVFQLLEVGYASNEWKGLAVQSIGYSWIAGWTCQCLWQMVFSRQTVWGMWICVILLLSAAASFASALRSLYLANEQAGKRMPPSVYLLFMMPTAVNTAWLSVASSAGILIAFQASGADFTSLELGAVLLACLVSSVGVYLALKKRDAAYGFTLTWAFVAVYSKQKSDLIHYTSLVATAVMLLVSMLALTKKGQAAARPVDPASDSIEDLQESLLSTEQAVHSPAPPRAT